MRVSDTDETFSAKPPNLIRVVRNHMHLFNELNISSAPADLGINRRQIAAEEFIWSLLVSDKLRGRNDQSKADYFVIDWNEPSPMEFLLIKNQSVVFRFLARSARIANP